MTEEQVFLAALDLPDLAARTAYLDDVCGENSELRRQVEELLAAHERSGLFLDEPAVEQMAAGPQSPVGQTVALDFEGGDAMADNKKTNPFPSDDGADDLNFLSPSTRPDSLGRLGHYETLQVLGRGSFGIVFRAFDDMLQRVVAVKVMAPQIATLSPARKRFLREARSSAAVRHENVVQVYEVGEQPLPYLVMEFIPGETLQQRLNRTGPLDVPEVLRLGRQIAEGLAAAHASDLIHRDIKPGNILLEGGSHHVKITDFGLARAADDASISQSGIVAGTPMFMAPEQALGHKIDQRADLFSLGSVLYQMVSGRPPFRAPSTLAVLKRVAEETPRPIPEIIPETPDWLCGIITKLHAKNPDDRFQSAREVADLLADCEAKLKAKQAVKNILPAAVKPAGRKWIAAAAVLLLPVIALAVTEFAGVTHLFRQQATSDAIKDGSGLTPNPGTKQGEPESNGWVQLFNGKDLTGWKTHPEQPGEWKVVDGVLMGSTVPSYLFSEGGKFENFHLRIEAKINHGGDSGIFFRAPFSMRQGKTSDILRPAAGYEVELQNNPIYLVPTGSVWDANTAGPPKLLWKTKQDWLTKADEWLTLEIIAQGNHIISKVNGTQTADCHDPLARYDVGHFALQVFNPQTHIQFRKIEIKELPPSSLPPTFKNSIGMEFVIVPKGKSWLGGGKDKLGDKEVVIPADFYLGKYEVTQEEWEKVMGENPSFFSRTGGGKDAVKDINDADLKRFPVEYVSWDQCQLFVAKLNKLEKETGWVYRLPKNSEWEYACRGGPMADKQNSAFNYYFGSPTNTLLADQANFEPTGLKRSCKVGSFAPNALGLFDMHGNVAEWCDEPWPQAARILHGGCWSDDSVKCTAVFGGVMKASGKNYAYGLRLARVPSGASSPEAKTPPTDPERKAAEYVLSVGGKVVIRNNPKRFTDASELPRVPFRLYSADLGRNEAVTDEKLPIFQGCTDLVMLDLTGTPVTDAGLVHLKDCKSLVALIVANTWVSTDLAPLEECENLASINLEATLITEAGLAHLKDCKGLTALSVSRTKVPNAWLGHIAACKNLMGLSLEDTSVTDAGLPQLAGLSRLIELNLRRTKVTAAGIEGLAKALPYCRIIWDGTVVDYVPVEFSAAEAKKQQEEWADKLKRTVETTNSIDLKLILIPPTGSPALKKPYLIGKYELMQEEWQKVMGDNRPEFNAKDEKSRRLPVSGPSWYDSVEFCNKLSEKEGLKPYYDLNVTKRLSSGAIESAEFKILGGNGYRLPTAAEWEHACRAGTKTDKLADLPEYAWFVDNSGGRRHAVGELKPNNFGLHDMLGNVSEWTDALSMSSFAGMLTSVVRGGYCNSPVTSCNVAYRMGFSCGQRILDCGFRVARSPVENEPPVTAVGFAPFTDADVKRIAALPAAEQIEEVRKELKKRNPGFDGILTPTIEKDAVTGLKFETDRVTDISPIRALTRLQSLVVKGSGSGKGSLADLSPLNGMSLTTLNANHNKVRDLTPLRGMPLKNLYVMESQVTDLAPLKGMPLEQLYLWQWVGSDLTPLKGMPLNQLNCGGGKQKIDLTPLAGLPLEYLCINTTQVSDLAPLKDVPLKDLECANTLVSDASPLKGMPLTRLLCHKTQLSDLSPLQGMQLKELRLTPKNITQGLDILRDMKSLKTIGIGIGPANQAWPAAEFWERHDKGEFKK